MPKHETPMTRWYWKQVGGTLVEEFVAVHRGTDHERRVLDAIIIPSGECRIAKQNEMKCLLRVRMLSLCKRRPSDWG